MCTVEKVDILWDKLNPVCSVCIITYKDPAGITCTEEVMFAFSDSTLACLWIILKPDSKLKENHDEIVNLITDRLDRHFYPEQYIGE